MVTTDDVNVLLQLKAKKNELDSSSEEIGTNLIDGKVELPTFMSVSTQAVYIGFFSSCLLYNAIYILFFDLRNIWSSGPSIMSCALNLTSSRGSNTECCAL